MSGEGFSDERVAAVSAVLARYEGRLRSFPHVLGVAVGVGMRAGVPTGRLSIVAYVDRKVPVSELPPDGVLPTELEGIGVDVVESGPIAPLPDTGLPGDRR